MIITGFFSRNLNLKQQHIFFILEHILNSIFLLLLLLLIMVQFPSKQLVLVAIISVLGEKKNQKWILLWGNLCSFDLCKTKQVCIFLNLTIIHCSSTFTSVWHQFDPDKQKHLRGYIKQVIKIKIALEK